MEFKLTKLIAKDQIFTYFHMK